MLPSASRLAGALLALALVGAACTTAPDAPDAAPLTSPTSDRPAPPTSEPEPAPPTTQPPVAAVTPSLAEVECDAEVWVVYDRTTCYTMTVPQVWDEPSDPRTVEVAVAVVRSDHPDRRPDPVVYLNGGPGAPTLNLLQPAHEFVIGTLGETRDVVFFDQRGIGLSTPRIRCTNLGPFGILERSASAQLDECFDVIEADDVDLASFDSTNAAHDIAVLRRLLGYDEWNLVGGSYGTLLGLVVARHHPNGVRTVVLDSPISRVDGATSPDQVADFERVLADVFAACGDDPACAGSVDASTLLGTFLDLADLDLTDVHDNPVTMDEAGVVLGLALRSRTTIELIPRMLDELDDGITTTYELLAYDSGFGGLDVGAQVAVLCHDLPELLDLSGARPVCDRFDLIDQPTPPLRAPVLILGGGLDPVTPVDNARTLHDAIDGSTLVEDANAAHGVMADSPCVAELAQRWVDAPDEEIDTEQCRTGTPLRFFPEAVTPEIDTTDVDLFGWTIDGVPYPSGWTETWAGTWQRDQQLGDPATWRVVWWDEDLLAEFDIDPTADALLAWYTGDDQGEVVDLGVAGWTARRATTGSTTNIIAVGEVGDRWITAELTAFTTETDALLDALLLPFVITDRAGA